MVCNNPESNMGNAVGCAPVLQMIKKGITVGLVPTAIYLRYAGEPEGRPL